MSARKKPASTTTTAPISGATTSPFGGVAAFNNSSLVQSLRAQAAATGESVAGSDNVDGKASMMRYLMKLAKNPKLRKYAKKYGKKLMKMSQKEAKKFLEEKAKEADDKSGSESDSSSSSRSSRSSSSSG
tara:strand:+ start:67 stop:456 length:390 start_codon:yes stop_codon:yes gene_type:complete